jgi:nucleoid-associated protein YgaU
MRTEVKVAVVVVLVAVIAAGFYFFSGNGSEKTIELPKPKAEAPTIITPKEPIIFQPPEVKKDDAPVDNAAADKQSPTTQPHSVISPIRTVVINQNPQHEPSKATLKIDLAPTTKPAVSSLKDEIREALAKSMEDKKSEKKEHGKKLKSKVQTEDATAIEDNAAAESDSPSSSSHTVREGETLYTIAKKYYGRGELWTIIARANSEVNPENMRLGQKLTIPARKKAVNSFEGITEAETKKIDSKKFISYTVKSGDTLADIAEKHLGSPSKWKEILAVNKGRISSPRDLKVGQVLLIPKK